MNNQQGLLPPSYNMAGQQPAYPHQGYPPQYQPQPQQQQQPTAVINVPSTQVVTVMVGNCPVCHVGTLRKATPIAAVVFAIILGILFFPLGLLIMIMMKERVCTHCGARFGR